MEIDEMHYDLKLKLNKLDSNQYRNLLVPEIDWVLNEAETIFIKSIAQPRFRKNLGFEMNQRTIDDIRTVVVNQVDTNGSCVVATKLDDESYLAPLPDNYWFFLSGKALASEDGCSDKVRLYQIQHDDKNNDSYFYKPSFIWRRANIKFVGNDIRVFTGKTMEISVICLDYIRKTPYIHNAEKFPGATYNDLKGNALTGSVNCELPDGVHNEIVDLAVLIITGQLQIPDYNIKKEKLFLNN